MPLFETLQDNFNDNSLDSTKWPTNSTVSAVNNRVEALDGDNYFSSDTGYSLINSYVKLRFNIDYTVELDDTAIYFLDITNSLGDYVQIGFGNGLLHGMFDINGRSGDSKNLSYDRSTHKWLRIKEQSGTIYFQYSTDDLNWNTFYSVDITGDESRLESCRVAPIFFAYKGMSDDVTVWIDSFNIIAIEYTKKSPGMSLRKESPPVGATTDKVIVGIKEEKPDIVIRNDKIKML